MPKTIFSRDTNVINFYLELNSIAKTSKAFQIDRGTVSNILKKNNIPLRTASESSQLFVPRGEKHPWHGKETYKLKGEDSKVVEMYLNGESMRKIGKVFNVHDNAVRTCLIKNNVSIRQPSQPSALWKSLIEKYGSQGVLQQMIECYQNGDSTGVISTNFGITPSGVFLRLKGKVVFRTLSETSYFKGKFGAEAPSWKGGVSTENELFRKSAAYKEWRKAVFRRDKWSCVFCGVKGTGKQVIIHADHIKPFAQFPELRLDINNGRTLCQDCHRKTETYGVKLKRQFGKQSGNNTRKRTSI